MLCLVHIFSCLNYFRYGCLFPYLSLIEFDCVMICLYNENEFIGFSFIFITFSSLVRDIHDILKNKNSSNACNY